MADSLIPSLPEGYDSFLRKLKARIQQAQVKAALAVNRELILLYWEIGKEIVERQEEAGWGSAVLDQLSADLNDTFPGVSGFSRRNLYRNLPRLPGRPRNCATACGTNTLGAQYRPA